MRESLTPALLALILAGAAPLEGAAPSTGVPATAAPKPAVAEPTVPAELKTLVDRQRALLVRADQAAGPTEVEDLRADFQRLVADYEQFITDYPKVAAGYVSYALLLSRPMLGERERAAALLLKANELDPNQPLVKNQLGNYLAEDGKPLQAVNYFLAAIQLAPKEPLYHYQLGTLLAVARDDFLASGEWKRSVLDDAMQEAFQQATTLAPDNIEYALAYGKSFYELDRPDWAGAMQYWRALELRLPPMALPKPGLIQQTIHLYETKVLLKQGKLDEARTLLATVDDPQLASARQKVAAELGSPPAPAPATGANITVPAVGTTPK